jgi:hypothetical protein
MGEKCRGRRSHREKRSSVLNGDFSGFNVMTRLLHRFLQFHEHKRFG